MRWFSIATAKIPAEIRQALEQRGAETMRVLLLQGNSVIETAEGKRSTVDDNRAYILSWLKEQADQEERRETWLLTMEVAITLFVGVDLEGVNRTV
jgi:hypothetical protein